MFNLSVGIPPVNYSPPIEDLFANFGHNWTTLTPVMALLLGVLFGFFVLKKIIEKIKDDDD